VKRLQAELDTDFNVILTKLAVAEPLEMIRAKASLACPPLISFESGPN
jgi:hypothetical protein